MGPASTETIDTTRRTAILAAAKALFLHYGFRRTSLEEIANEAGISRTGLYHHFRNKDDIFLAIAEELYWESKVRADAAAKGPGSFPERLRNVLAAKMDYYFALICGTRHGAELTDAKNRFCGGLIARQQGVFLGVLVQLFRDAEAAGEIVLKKEDLTPEAAAELVYHAAVGLQGTEGDRPSPEGYSRRLDQLVRVTAAGLRGVSR